MISRVNRACGLDVHKSTIAATIISADGTTESRKYPTTLEGLLELRSWILEHSCERVLMEATGIYWIPVHAVLESRIDVHLVNPLFIKYLPGRKTDLLDSAWLAEVALNGLYRPSYIPCRSIRELRDLTRMHRKLVEARTREKNRIHKLLVKNGIRIAAVLADIFGKSGKIIIAGIMEKKSVDQIFSAITSKRILKKRAEIEAAIGGELSESDAFVIAKSLESLKHLNAQIKEYDERILQGILNHQNTLKLLMSIPGFGFTVACCVLAEIGDVRQFPGPKHLVSWAGLAPSIYESAGKTSYGHITKQGSKHLRTILVEAAHVIATRGSGTLRSFFLRIRSKKGYKIAIVALARKLLVIVYHLLIHEEPYLEDNRGPKPVKISKPPSSMQPYDLQKIIGILIEAGYQVHKP